jgi:hypothetical protein
MAKHLPRQIKNQINLQSKICRKRIYLRPLVFVDGTVHQEPSQIVLKKPSNFPLSQLVPQILKLYSISA